VGAIIFQCILLTELGEYYNIPLIEPLVTQCYIIYP